MADKDYQKAISLDEDDPYPLSSLASLLAACPEEKLRNGQHSELDCLINIGQGITVALSAFALR